MGHYKVIGMMSGTSMDGIDLAYCEFTELNGTWSFEIKAAETIPYETKWRNRLSQLYKQTAMIYAKTHAYYGRYIGELIREFISKHKVHAEFIASHGHTVFHSPENFYTSQIGCGANISAATGLPVVCDFRSTDVALGGQGAPLVPIGDKYLFSEFGFCLNLGGFANISANASGIMRAFDIAPCNIVLNRCARMLDALYDEDGAFAASGSVNQELLQELNNIEFYRQNEPKSLSREWINTSFWPLNKNYRISPQDKLATLCEHIAIQVAAAVHKINGELEIKNQRMLLTGGGALNQYLVERLREKSPLELVLPEQETINFKEALIFAFLGVLRVQHKHNCLQSVTGASHDNIGGAMYGDFSAY